MIKALLSVMWIVLYSGQLWAEQFVFDVPMYSKGASTYYIAGKIGNMPETEFMVDTGSSYMTINEATLSELQANGSPRYLRDLKGILANGDVLSVPVYTITNVRIGEECLLDEVDVAVFPGKTRQILGLSALSKTAPFIFSTQPPQLQLSHCHLARVETGNQTKLAAGIATP
ncbi:retropepsin-like aspartic protease [Candidatus Thiodiazotropha sp. CDECU1]|uniref:retropepsin-like aspartic protease n=1 Tax=Candidatus Thiodiazotropha sp. CDECU1 TaxID=3065865 RepID=UPI002930E1D3|nr:retropepsin-like aspartic protease [Candidatus Thiodiazotropha sp. CDECU1]